LLNRHLQNMRLKVGGSRNRQPQSRARAGRHCRYRTGGRALRPVAAGVLAPLLEQFSRGITVC